LAPPKVFTQEDSARIAYGIWGSVNLNFHSSDFKSIPSCPSCSPGYKDGFGLGFSLGALVDFPIYDSWSLSGKIFYKDLSGVLTSIESTSIVQKTTNDKGEIIYKLAPGEFEHRIDASLSIFGISPSLKYNFYDKFYCNFGIQSAILIQKEYSQVERITKPNFGTFLDSKGEDTYSRERNKYSGALKSTNSIHFGANLGLSYKLPMNKKGDIFFEPEISYNFAFSNIISSNQVNKWKVNSLDFGVAFKYSPIPKAPLKHEYKKIENIDTIRIISPRHDSLTLALGSPTIKSDNWETETSLIHQETITRTDTIFTPKMYKFTADINAFGVDSLGYETDNPKFKIEEFVSNRLDPLLPYIFFENNSSNLDPRYRRVNAEQAINFRIENLFRESVLDIYYNLLNIVGQRLNEHPKAKLTIVGCNADVAEEKGAKALSKTRAEIVKQYLVDIWKIEPERLKIEARNLSTKASTPKNQADKMQENRRVELYSDNYEILKPVFIEKTDRIAYAPTLRFKTDIIAEAGLKQGKIIAFQKSDSTNVRFESKISDLIQTAYDWHLNESQKSIPIYSEPIDYYLSVRDEKNKELTIHKSTLPLDVITIQKKRLERLGDYEFEKFSLILFDFNSAKITGNNQKIIDFIKNRITANSEIEILGLTDRTGESERNSELSIQRAEAVKREIKATTAIPKIGNEYLYDNQLPEGRFYCRTVNIVIKNRIK
jgi:outer membrane protein OmpA-like peptidoglycan-associated protein